MQQLDGRYEIVKPLSAGGFGKTYLARDLKIPGTPFCVVKQLHCASQNIQERQLAQQLFQREAESLAKLGHHDQIPRLLAYFTENNEFYLVEDYIEGRSLEQEIVNGQPWPEASVIELIKSILDVLAYVHQQGVIHRDIKPGNLIRRYSDNKIVLIDFGAIKQVEQAHPDPSFHRTGTQIGTAGFMPPEQAQGKPRPNSDIYGLGMVAIAALTGHAAFALPDDPQTGEILWQHLTHVSPTLGQILTRMVRYHFQQRYQSVEEVQQDLQRLHAGSTPPPAPSSPAVSYPVSYPPSIESHPTQVASPGYTQPQPPVSPPPQAKKASGLPWMLGISLAILIPILGGVASILIGNLSNSNSKAPNGEATPTLDVCTAIVNGNIRSERTSFQGNSNILRTGQGQAFEIGTRETRGGWIEIKLPSGRTAWTHLDVVSNESALKACLRTQNIQLEVIPDIARPAPPRPQPTPITPSPTPTPSIDPDIEDADEDTEGAVDPSQGSDNGAETDGVADDSAPPTSGNSSEGSDGTGEGEIETPPVAPSPAPSSSATPPPSGATGE